MFKFFVKRKAEKEAKKAAQLAKIQAWRAEMRAYEAETRRLHDAYNLYTHTDWSNFKGQKYPFFLPGARVAVRVSRAPLVVSAPSHSGFETSYMARPAGCRILKRNFTNTPKNFTIILQKCDYTPKKCHIKFTNALTKCYNIVTKGLRIKKLIP